MKNVLKIKNPKTGEFEPIASISGADGAPGKDGQGVPTGGTVGQVLKKTGSGDYEAAWSDSAGDSEKLGGVAAAQYALKNNVPAHNLLDNSNFVDPVNQRGKTSYGAGGYTIDRWYFYNPNGDGTVTINNGYISLTGGSGAVSLSCRFPKGFLDANKTYTARICDNLGNINPTGLGFYDSFDSFELSAGAGETKNIVWAALYEGSYTPDTLPAYVPKGYAAELAECRRYYKVIDVNVAPWLLESTTMRRYYVGYEPMRTAPTVDVSGLKEYSIWTALESAINPYNIKNNRVLLSANAETTSTRLYIGGSIALSADL